jgi:phenylacetate-CoA ligase
VRRQVDRLERFEREDGMSDHVMQLLADDALERAQLELLRPQLAYVRERSALYRDKLRDVDVDGLRSLAAFAELPLTEKDELRRSQDNAPPLGDNLCTATDEPIRISSTSGTTGKPLYYAVTPDDIRGVWASWKNMYDAAGVGPGERVMFGFAIGGPFGAHYGADALEYAGIQCIPVGSSQSSNRFLQLMRDLAPTVLACVTNFPMRLAERLREDGTDPRDLRLEKMMLAAEPVAPVRAAIEETWGSRVYEMMGTGEIGMIWGECEARAGMHYLSKGLVLVEFIDPETLQTVRPEPGAMAELVYTHLRREACPLVRYRTRDLVTIHGVDCECGRRGARIGCVGRTDDMLKVRGVNVFPSAIADLLNRYGRPVTDNFRIRLPEGERKFSTPLSLIVGVEPMPPTPEDVEGLQERLADYLRASLNVRTTVELISSSELGVALRGGLDRRDYFVEA